MMFDESPPSSPEDLAALLLIGGGALLIHLLYHGLVAYALWRLYLGLPEAYRQLRPGLVWLLLIPCFAIGWNFVVLLQLSRSYEDRFRDAGLYAHGNCYYGLGLAYCITYALLIIPCHCTIFPLLLASVTLIIIYLSLMFGLQGKLPAAAAPPSTAPPSP
jgi:hypothetical protein